MQSLAQIQRGLASRLATRGDRLNIERLFYIDALPLIARWYDRIRSVFITSGVLERAYIQAKVVGTIDIPRAQINSYVDQVLKDLTFDVTEDLMQDPMRVDLVSMIRKWKYRCYDVGAVAALRLMGIQAEGEWTSMKAVDPIDFKLVNQQAIMNLENAALTSVGFVQRTTIREARNSVKNVIYLNGGTIDDAAKALGVMTLASKAEALKIVRTEAQVAFSGACQEVYEKSGIRKKSWATVGDHRVRNPHVVNEGAGAIPVHSVFPSAQIHPGDPGPRVLHINCRCTLLPVFSRGSSFIPWTGG